VYFTHAFFPQIWGNLSAANGPKITLIGYSKTLIPRSERKSISRTATTIGDEPQL
jgi:hypothetical protein